MALNYPFALYFTRFLPFFFFFFLCTPSSMAAVNYHKQSPQPVFEYHKGTLLKGNIIVNLIWYGDFHTTSVILDFLQSLSSPEAQLVPSVSAWWGTTKNYRGSGGGSSNILLGKQIYDNICSLGKKLNDSQIIELAAKGGSSASGWTINVVLTANDVAVERFCMSRCGTHGSNSGLGSSVYAWVGNSETQCPGQCSWPFHQPLYGPQTPPLVPPNGDVGVDGMVINLATVLAGTVTNPFNSGYFQGPKTAPLEAVSACPGIFGSGAYPGYPGKLLVDKSTGASYNANGLNGRKYLLPAMWDPATSKCSTLV